MIEIEISYALDDSGNMQLWARGHHSWGEFTKAVGDYLQANGRSDIPRWVFTQAPVNNVYQRTVPCRGSDVSDTRYVHTAKPGRGATPVTVLDFWFPTYQGKQQELAVWYGSMPESNGKNNWTAILHRKGDVWGGITIDRSEYPDRVRYEADRVRFLIGESDKEPWVTDYDADKCDSSDTPAATFETAQAQRDDSSLVRNNGVIDSWKVIEKYAFDANVMDMTLPAAIRSVIESIKSAQQNDDRLDVLPFAYEQTVLDEKGREIQRRLFYAKDVGPLDAYVDRVSFKALYTKAQSDPAPVGYLSCDPETGKPVWSEACVCEDNVYSVKETGTIGRPIMFADTALASERPNVPKPLPGYEEDESDSDFTAGHKDGYVQGWNACREAMLKGQK